MEVQLGKIVGDQQERLLPAIRSIALRRSDIGLHVPPGFVEGFGEHCHVLVRALNTVKWRFGLAAHKYAFPTSLPPQGGPTKLRFPYSPTIDAVVEPHVTPKVYSWYRIVICAAAPTTRNSSRLIC